jgi:deoxyhypusine synthase
MVTPAGGVEEDVIKCCKPFVLGTFEAPGEQLFDNGINRTGNIFVPNDRFTEFDKFMREFLESLYEKYTKKGTTLNTAAFTKELGLAIGTHEATKGTAKESYLYWAAKNSIPVVCPAIMDGSLGDMVHFFRQRHPDFIIDAASDIDILIRAALNAEKSGAIILGAGMCKHYILNANIFREGLDYTVYINTAQEFDGSDSGARIEEAITWGKVKPRTPAVKVHCDATIAFPLLVAATFAKEARPAEEANAAKEQI